MANMTVTNVDLGNVVFESGVFRDGALTFADEGVVVEGTILARDTVSGDFVPYVIAGETNGNDVPTAVLTYDVEATGAGDVPCRVMVSGKVRTERLVVDADGDNSNITESILDELRSVGIVAVDVRQLSGLDNQ